VGDSRGTAGLGPACRRDAGGPSETHLTLPSLRDGPLPLPPEGRRGILCARGLVMTGIVLAAVIGYLLGSIPFGLVLTRLAGLGDVRRIGSGSIGATNVLRTGNKALAAFTLALDLAKGVAAVLIGSLWGGDAMLAAAAAVILGHMFPVWLGFRGGKGVATALGVLLVIAWPVAVAAGALWLVTAIVFHYSSLAALIGAVAAVVLAAVMVEPARALLIAGIAVLVILRHHENIRRLVAGTEGRISFGKG
jgi:glycerol-3-phosphate acyltransferase PlsY